MSKLPTTRLDIKLKIDRSKIAEYLVPRKIDLDTEVEELIDQYVAQAPKDIQNDNKEAIQKTNDSFQMEGDDF